MLNCPSPYNLGGACHLSSGDRRKSAQDNSARVATGVGASYLQPLTFDSGVSFPGTTTLTYMFSRSGSASDYIVAQADETILQGLELLGARVRRARVRNPGSEMYGRPLIDDELDESEYKCIRNQGRKSL